MQSVGENILKFLVKQVSSKSQSEMLSDVIFGMFQGMQLHSLIAFFMAHSYSQELLEYVLVKFDFEFSFGKLQFRIAGSMLSNSLVVTI